MSEAMLVADRLTRHFGGLTANLEVCITLERGKLHALLGPNGAGKSTCINMLSGDLPPSAGRILLEGQDVTGLDSAARSHRGIGRSYQRTTIFPEFTVSGDVDDSEAAWKWSSPVRARTHDPAPRGPPPARRARSPRPRGPRDARPWRRPSVGCP